jgi:hypothetical protein
MPYASAPYIGFVDADDWIEPDMYEKLYEKMSEHHCDIVMCQNWRDTAAPGQVLAPKRTGQEDRLFEIDTVEKRKTFLVCGSIGYGVWDKLFTREFLTENQIFFPEYLAYEDHFFATLLYFYAKRVYIIEERLYHYFVNSSSTVLTTNGTHHLDILTVDMMMWEECEKRGFLETYRKELEYQFLTLCYLAAMKMLSLRLTEIPYDFFLKLKEETLKRVPDYHQNPYIKDYVTEMNQILLQLLELPIGEAELNEVCKAVRKKYSKGILQIYVMTHVAFHVPEDPIYHPLHVGHAIHEDLGYPGDDTGDNISELNPYYSELTGLYWVWKNVRNVEYAGLCHYRRYFLNEKNAIMTKADFMPILAEYDVILSQPVTSEKCYRDIYAEAHNIHDLEAVGDAIAALYPDCTPIFQETLASCRLYCGNLFVTRKELFDEYAAWLFSIFDVASEHIDVSGYDDYHKRVYGFLSEQLLFVWVRYRKLTYYEAPIGFTQEKAETISLKKQMTELFEKRQIRKASALYLETLRSRPDLTLPGSDFHQELDDMQQLIYICLKEEEDGVSSFLDYATNLNKLLQHCGRVTGILERCADHALSGEDIAYLKAHAVSACAIDAILSIIEKEDRKDEIHTILRSNGIL